MMKFMKSYLTGSLIDPYVCIPSSLKQQTLRYIALTLCHNSSIRRQIFNPEIEIVDDSSPEQVKIEWEKSFNEALMEVFKTLFIPQVIQEPLIGLIRSMALQLLIWSGEWKHMYCIPCNFTADLWLPTDWIENRLCELKIAERIMEDDRLTIGQRYEIACVYCLEEFIPSLWNQLSSERKEIYLYHQSDKFPAIGLIYGWTQFLTEPERFPNEDHLSGMLITRGAYEYQVAAVMSGWRKCDIDRIYPLASVFLEFLWNSEKLLECEKQVLPFKESSFIQLPKSSGQGDVFCCTLMQVHKHKGTRLEANLKNYEPAVKHFLEWPQGRFS